VKAEDAHGQVKMIGRSVRFGHAKGGAAAEHTIVLWYLSPLENYKPSGSFYEQASPAITGASPAWVLGGRRPADGAAMGGEGETHPCSPLLALAHPPQAQELGG
jgi:hypothetical protein